MINKSLKSLYYNAKQSGSSTALNEFVSEATKAVESNPHEFASNIDCIISCSESNTLIPTFLEKWGLPIPMAKIILEKVNQCIESGKRKHVNVSVYQDTKSYVEKFIHDNKYCVAMYEYYSNDTAKEYISDYYTILPKYQTTIGKIPLSMLKRHNESAIPDIIIQAKQYRLPKLLNTIIETYEFDPIIMEWIDSTMKYDKINKKIPNTASSICESVINRNKQLFRESVIMGHDTVAYEASEQELDTLQNYISYLEYTLTWATELGIPVSVIQNKIYEAYQEIENCSNEDADAIIAMLPDSKMESPAWQDETSDKKTSGIPPYLKRNHDMISWGEDEPEKKKTIEKKKPAHDVEDEEEPEGIDQFRRPSSVANDKELEVRKSINDAPDEVEDKEDEVKTPISRNGNITNYYYYTYTNSLNKNDNSFNRTRHDDHSHHSTDDHSASSDNHSVTTNHIYTGTKKDEEKDKKEDIKNESVNPWEINFDFDQVFNEAAEDDNSAANVSLDDAPTDTYDDGKPQSDHPIKDALMDIDRQFTKVQQGVKKGVQNITNVGKAVVKPINRTKDWISGMITKWKDADETNIKEKLAAPTDKFNLFGAIKKSIQTGALLKAGILMNPIFLAIAALRTGSNNKHEQRLKNEMQLELQQEMDILKEKIKDADSKATYGSDEERDQARRDKYKLMRFKTELQKKLWRVQGNDYLKKLI